MMKSTRFRDRKNIMKRTRSTTLIEIVKPPSDTRSYRVVILPNGITAMLISEAEYQTGDSEDTGVNRSPETPMEIDENREASDGEAAAALCVGIGSFSDPQEVPGFAHFMEHMVFMGSKKFPKENYWDDFLAKNGGESNAWTDCERTCFYFVCEQSSFVKAMDVFAQFFISPLFIKGSVDREIMAVDNECQMAASNDNERMRGVMGELVEEGHPMAKFMAGNKKSLKDDPQENNINVYEMLHAFNKKMYSAHYMTLVVHSLDTLDTLEKQVIKIFSKIPNNEIPRPKFIKPPFQERNMNKIIKVIPVGDVHKMEIIWALPPLMEHYRARVIEFLSLLLGHESKGSILSELRKKNLAMEISGGNDMTGFTHNSTWSAFMLSVKLTERGTVEYENVLDVIFQYIDLLKQKLPAHVFEEQKHIMETKYIFKEQESIYSYVEELAEDMHMYPPEHYLCGRTLYFEYNEQLIRDCLDFLRPQGMLVMLFNKSYNSIGSMKEEPWLGTKYYDTDVSPSLIKRLSEVPKNPGLMLPMPNPYIATNFSLVKARKSTKYPVVLMNEKACRIWYKKDNLFHLPNAFIYLHFISSTISKSSRNVALGDIFLTILLQKVTEILYNATLAGYEYSVEGTPEGVIFTFGGYSEKIKLVTADTLRAFLDFEVDTTSFQGVVTHLKQVYINELIKPVELARAVRYSLLEFKDPSLLERYENMNSVTYDMMKEFLEDFYSSLFIEGFVTGNLRPEDALDIGEMAKKVVKKPLAESDFPKPNMLELPQGDFKCFMHSLNKEDTNSCVIHYFQQGLGTIRNSCLNELLVAAMNEPLFNVLRTENQLGYNVYCQHTTTHGVLSFIIAVESQANKFSMKHIDEIMTNFLRDFGRTLQEIPENKFNDMIEGQAAMKAADDADLFDESFRHWQEIVKQGYVFDRLKLEHEAMKNIRHQDVVDWYKELVSNKRRKLSFMIEGCSKTKCEMSSPATCTPFDSIKTLIKNLRTCTPIATNNVKPSLASKVVLEGADSLPQSPEEGVTYITNICEFKSKLTSFPYHVIKK